MLQSCLPSTKVTSTIILVNNNKSTIFTKAKAWYYQLQLNIKTLL